MRATSAVAILLCALWLAGCATRGRPNQASGERPNIVFLFTDDQRFDALGFLHPVLETPHLDRLAERGVFFPNAFVTSPICPSSRATVLTGLHEQTHGYTFGTPPLRLEYLRLSYPRLLRDAGYSSAFVGKNGAHLDAQRTELLFDRFIAVERDPYVQVREGEESHATDYTAKKAAELAAAATEPFMLTVWFNAPHAEDSDPAQFIPPERYADLYDGVDFPPPAGGEEIFDASPEFLKRSENRDRWHWRWTPELYDRMMGGYLAMIRGVDDAVGTILDALAASGRAERTVIVFMSDNGYFIGERGFAGKWLAYEPSILSPLLIHDPRPGRELRGRTLPHLVTNVDLPETILELAGIDVPAAMQGRSLVPLLAGESPPWRQDLFLEHSFTRPPDTSIPRYEGLRTESIKYIRYLDHDHEELYDLERDPTEARNLAGDPAYLPRLEAARKRTVELQRLYAGH
ncbi:MAG: sulfatase [bacterium]|nr:sulfatase [bacterium]